MQTFKEIPYQNYIELVFNQKNLNEVEQQQAMIKYKRNSQLLSEIFSFRKHENQAFKTQNNITEEQLKEFEAQIQKQKREGEQNVQRIKEKSVKFEELFKKINALNTKQGLMSMIEELKENDLYDSQHPFFAEGSPFYLNSSIDQYLEVRPSKVMQESQAALDQELLKQMQGIDFLPLN